MRGGARPNSGGKRLGAGRPKGSQNKVNAEMRAKVLKKGVPLDIIMDAACEFVAAADRLKDDQVVIVNERAVTRLTLMERAAAIAKDAAPYVHPKLCSVEQSGPEGGPLELNFNVEFVNAKQGG